MKIKKSIFVIAAMCLIIVISSCQQPSVKDIDANDFQIYLTTMVTLIEAGKDQNWTFDVLQDADYIITDDQVVSYDWDKQMIVLDDTVRNKFVKDSEFLSPFTAYAIVWNGEVVARGQVSDIGSPFIPQHPVLFVLEPVGDPEYSSRRFLSSHNPAYASIQDFTVVLRTEKKPAISLDENVSEFVYEDSIAKEIEAYFLHNDRLTN